MIAEYGAERASHSSSSSPRPLRPRITSSPQRPFESVIQVVVGPPKRNPTTFIVHDALLVNSSPFFRTCLTQSWKESATGVITLPEERADTFALFLQWLYYQHSCSLTHLPSSAFPTHILGDSSIIKPAAELPSASSTTTTTSTTSSSSPSRNGSPPTPPTPPPPPRVAPRFYPYIRLYIFAFQYLLPSALKNAIVDRIAQLADQHNSVPNVDDVNLIWEALPPDAPIRNLVLDLFAWKRTERLLREGTELGWAHEFLWELCRRLKLKKIGAGPPWRRDCRGGGGGGDVGDGGCCCAGYHEHEDGVDCEGRSVCNGCCC